MVMKKYIAKVTAVSLLATAMIVLPVVARAQNANADASAPTETTPKAKKHHLIPFRGKLVAVDVEAKTLKVGKRTFQITSETKILKDGEPATLTDGVIGERVRGAYMKTDDDKLEVVTLHFGAKNAPKHKKPSADKNEE